MFLLSIMLIKVKVVSFEHLSLKFLLIDAMPLEKKSLDLDGKCLTLVEIKDLPLEEVLLVCNRYVAQWELFDTEIASYETKFSEYDILGDTHMLSSCPTKLTMHLLLVLSDHCESVSKQIDLSLGFPQELKTKLTCFLLFLVEYPASNRKIVEYNSLTQSPS